MSQSLADAVRQRLQEPRGRPTSVAAPPPKHKFTLSAPGSENSSRDSSPARPQWKRTTANGIRHPSSTLVQDDDDDDDVSILKKVGINDDSDELLPPGRRPVDVYDATLPPWRAAIRRKLVKYVQRESEVVARLQNSIRTPWLDAYFVYSSSLGTHTFFTILLPAFFFFGYYEMGLGLMIVLALGIYLTSFLKDLICSPRPFAPPVTRLTIGTHHLEYGFPSTHSTNAVSIALFVFGYAHRLASTPAVSNIATTFQNTTTTTPTPTNSTFTPSSLGQPTTPSLPALSPQLYALIVLLLCIYTFSIVFGRIYTAMHSFTDCIVGVALGAGIWWFQTSWAGIPITLNPSNPLYWLFSSLWPSNLTVGGATYVMHLGKGLGGGQWLEHWVSTGGWEVPLILIPLSLLAVNQHPQPVDDCPCFEDAIAIGSVLLGALVARWAITFWGLRMYAGKAVVMPGSGWMRLDLDEELGAGWVKLERGFWDVVVWWAFACLKMVTGILIIFIWRLLAKSALHLILPPIFRGLARVFSLPNRRFYTPATDYKNVPSDFSTGKNGGGIQLHPIPSVIDLPSRVGVGTEVGGIGSGVSGVSDYGVGGAGAGNNNNNGMMKKIRNGVNHANGNNGATSNEKGGGPSSTTTNFIQDVEHEEKTSLNKDKDGQPVKHYDADVLTKVIVYAGIAVLACEAIPAMFEILGWGVRSSI